MRVAKHCCWLWLTAYARAGRTGSGARTPSYTEAQVNNINKQATKAVTDTTHDAKKAASNTYQQTGKAASDAYHGASAGGQHAVSVATPVVQQVAAPVVNAGQSTGSAINQGYKDITSSVPSVPSDPRNWKCCR